MSGKSKIQAQVQVPTNQSAANFFKSLAQTSTDLRAHLDKENANFRSIDKYVVERDVYENFEKMNAGTDATSNSEEYSASGDGAADAATKNSPINKKNADCYSAFINFTYQGSLKELAADPDKSKFVVSFPAAKFSNHKPIILSMDVTGVHNTTPLPINFKLHDMPRSNLWLDNAQDTFSNVSYGVGPNEIHPRTVNDTIYERSQGEFKVSRTQWDNANVSLSEIKGAIGSPEALDSQPELKKVIHENGIRFVLKDSEFGRYIASQLGEEERISLVEGEYVDDHYVLHEDDVQAHLENLVKEMDGNPFGKIDGMVGEISRQDGKPWDYMYPNISEAQKRDLLEHQQTFCITTKIGLQAFEWS